MRLTLSIAVFVLCAASLALPADAQSNATANNPRAFEIAKRSDDTDAGFGDSTAAARMILRNTAGQSAQRRFILRSLEEPADDTGEKSLVVFEAPPDIEGTALLSHANILAADDQWLYLPALKRVKRISTANKSGAFMGSEFAFEDFTLTELHKFSYANAGEETLDGAVHDVIDRTPVYEGSGYSKQRAWIDRDAFQMRKVEFYDRRGALLKTLHLSDYRAYGSIWRPHRLVMKNHHSGKETELLYEAYRFGSGLDRNDFAVGVLTRVR